MRRNALQQDESALTDERNGSIEHDSNDNQ